MDTALLKYAPPLPVTLPSGLQIDLRPLSPAAIERAWLQARLSGRDRRFPSRPAPNLLHGVLCLLEAATGCDLGAELFPGEALALFRRWARHQQRCCDPSIGKLRGWLRRRVNDDPDVIKDGHRATMGKTAQEYYGEALVDLTDGQVAYWQLLASAYNEFHPSGGQRKKEPTKQWLQTNP